MLQVILFIAGFFLLIYGANWLVDGASSIAKKFNISNIVIGLTIVALGTSSPELVVNLIASIQGNADVAMGNILGSNISNIFLILGVSALIYPLAVNRGTQTKEIPLALLAAIVLGIVANDRLVDGIAESMIRRSDGVVLVAFFILFIHYAFSIAKHKETKEIPVIRSLPLWKSILLIIAGIGGLVLGGNWIVDGAVFIALWAGMREATISLTIVALGTSLPELATCAVAAYKRNTGIVFGNVIGSNLFNIFFVLGVSAIIKPIPFEAALNYDIIVGILAVFILMIFLFLSKKKILAKWQGGVFLFLYVIYITILVLKDLY